LAATLYERHSGAQRLVADAVRRQDAHVGIWEDKGSDHAGGLEHRLSGAARAFKPHALAAAGLTADVSSFETFRNGRRR
jgi:hypothetical protein